MASSDEDVMNSDPDMGDDLFGDEEEDEAPKVQKPRQLSDDELDSGDDEGRQDRRAQRPMSEDAEQENENVEARIQTVWRHPLPKPLDEELNSLRLPKFLGIEPRAYVPETFSIPTTDHHSEPPSANFSARAVAATTMRFRKDSAGNLESNTLIYKWSDGSTTLCIGDQHYELEQKPLAPPKDGPYQEVLDSHSYVATPSLAAQLLNIFGHMTNQYTVRPNKDIEDDALEKLQKSLAAAARGSGKGDDKNGPEMITNTEDPELQKKKAEMAEKERMKLQRRRETAAEKASIPSGPRGGRSGGLTVDDLERSSRRGPATGRKAAGTKRPRRKTDDYDSEDDNAARGRPSRMDEYDTDDGFLVNSDEEMEVSGEDDEEEELLDEDSDREAPRAKKQKKSKPEEVSDADAEADLDDDEAPAPAAEPSGRSRKRNIIEDDDDE
ncbi:hypothetical protein HYFRA_00002896 [Hymenoscyphus fraxineus]|uniref:Leo1-like protein n=1 Tax=Hymenoscyphus fraxineus TaxID=746836 RepID=A0A9N9KPE0_9HELO|nr:hypothetical protein HYFRA_00002896 [Hymenoscyphus fraxineus]